MDLSIKIERSFATSMDIPDGRFSRIADNFLNAFEISMGLALDGATIPSVTAV